MAARPLRSRYGKGVRRGPRTQTKLEADYAVLLEGKKRLGEIRDFAYEALTLRLGHDCRYTPDFMVMAADDVIECHECKGHRWAKNMVKLRVAADRFPFRFYLCERSAGAWAITPFE